MWHKWGKKRGIKKLSEEKPGRNRSLRRPKNKWLEKSKMDLVELRLGDVDWIGLIQDRDKLRALVNAVMNFRVP
jgi:hypothetical protein